MVSALEQNAADLEQELAWLARLIDARFAVYFNLDGATAAEAAAPPDLSGSESPYARFLREAELSFAERTALVLALAPHLRPQLLDVFFTRNQTFDRRFTEFGGARREPDGDFWPTAETLAFILGGTGTHVSPAGREPLGRGDVVLLRPGVWHAYEDCTDLRLYNCCFGAELPDGIENPAHAKATVLERLGGTKERFKICLRALFAQQHDADGERDFRIDNILLEQVLGEIRDDESVVLRLAQEGSDPFEGFEELGKIVEGIALAQFLMVQFDAMANQERAARGKLDGAFQVQMKLGFGKRIDLRGERQRRHPKSLMREGWTARVVPGGEPEGADVGSGVGKLTDQNCTGLIVEAVVILVGVGVLAAKGVAVGKED